MADSISPLVFERDGTSQARRLLAALKADYAVIDERSLKDQLRLADAFAAELKYFNFDNVEDGDWQGLLNPDGLTGKEFLDWLEQIEAFIAQPENYTDERFYNLHRPHFVLYLVFLQLLKNVQKQLNRLTGRHLDFYYRSLLGFSKTPGQPDRVNVLAEPSSQKNSALLPAGTLLAAGKDSSGKERVYRTDSELVVNHAKVAQLSSIFVNKQVIDIRRAREQYTGTKNDAIIEMLKIALGDPMPGDNLPPYAKQKLKVDFNLLEQLQTLVKFVVVDNGLFLEISELRSLIRLKNNRGATADSDWQTINKILSGPINKRPAASLTLTGNPRDFNANIKAALGFSTLEDYFSTLTLVENFTQLYEQRTREEVREFMDAKQLDIESFNEMMRLKVRIDNEWQEINSLLDRAGQRKRIAADFHITAVDPPDFDKHFASALGSPIYPAVTGMGNVSNLDGFYDTLLTIEAYFFMPMEDFALMMAAANDANTSDAVWSRVYAQLEQGYQKKVYASHKKQLNGLRLGQNTVDSRKLATQTMMQLALGIPETDNIDLLNRVKELLPMGTDLSLLNQAAGGAALADKDWDSVCGTLELAWRNRVPTPVAQKENWLSLSAYEETSKIIAPDSSDSNRWYMFGQRQVQAVSEQAHAPEAKIGWAVSSPVLCLAQGKRTVTLTLVFKAEQFNAEKIGAVLSFQPFRIELSTAKGWLNVNGANASVGDYVSNSSNVALKRLTWKFSFDESAAAIDVLLEPTLNTIKTSWPVLKLMLLPRWDVDAKTYVTDYPLFQGLLLEKVLLNVDVSGLDNLQLQNDETKLVAGKPFEPFGSMPMSGSRLYFTHPELMFKRLNKLDVNLQWMGAPNADLREYYKNYPAAIAGNTAFKSKIAMVDQQFELVLDNGIALFDKDNANTPVTLSVADVPGKIEKIRYGYDYQRQFAHAYAQDVTDWQRYYYLESTACDFQHSVYPGLAASKSIELAAAIAGAQGKSISTDIYKINPPYTPKLKSFSVNYSASIELAMEEWQNDGADQIYHLHPFGYSGAQFDAQNGGYNFLPTYNNEGELYIGLSNVQAPQTLSILLQLAEGTANPDLTAASVQWSILSGNRWLNLDKGQLQDDGTHGLLESGIVKLQLDDVTPSTLLPSDMYWLRIAVAERCDSVCDCIAMHTQAVTATFLDRNNAEDHLEQPLPAETIKSLVEPVATIASIKQPFTSFGAKPRELDSCFNTRVSERLRHKQRAVNFWDYEHLALERFSGLYKVKCIPAGIQENPGLVTVIVIPDIRNRLPFDPFAPKAPASLLVEIETFLMAHAPMSASVKVKNACYLPVKLRFAVRFQPGYDSSFYKQQLNEDVNRFLSPWAYEQGKDLVIGGKIYANAIIDFIERQAYVDYVAHFKLFLGDENGTDFSLVPKPDLDDNAQGYAVSTYRPDAVLVAAKSHDIDLITEVNYGEQIFNGINYMKLELDFIVG